VSQPKICAGCAKAIGPDEPYWRFAVALQGELDSLAAGASGQGTREDLEATLAELEHVDPDDAEAQVHEELSGVLCSACRSRLRVFLRRVGPGPSLH
jgi:hypothetical protein